ncbi:hypothetical protein ACWDTG_23975 [Rhodococcus zopfii]
MRAAGHPVSDSAVERVLPRRGLLFPVGFRADRRAWSKLRQGVHEPTGGQKPGVGTDFSEFETTGGGIWRICAVIDDAIKYTLALIVTPTSTATDAVACVDVAVAEA